MTLSTFEATYQATDIDTYNHRAVMKDIKDTFLLQYPKISKITSNEIIPWFEGESEVFITFRFALTESTYKELEEYYPEALI